MGKRDLIGVQKKGEVSGLSMLVGHLNQAYQKSPLPLITSYLSL